MLPAMRVGIVLPIGERGDPPRATPYAELRELALQTENSGLDSIWVADHLFYQPPGAARRGMWESWTVLAGLADATRRVELGPLVLCTPFRNPGLLAWMANTLDEVSAGRLVLGLGAGWHEPEFRAFDFEFERRVGLFADALEVIVPLLREGRVEHDGRLASGHAELHPRGPREHGPPILIAATRPRMMALAARWADRYNTVWYGRPTDEFFTDRRNLEAACADAGRDATDIEVTVGLNVVGDFVLDGNPGRSDALSGPPEKIADALAEWAGHGAAEVMCRIDPATPPMVERVARAADILRRG
jgi:alkanesulfonate monooxygenase SsuD/methylene tetrahydromethanopterin reductase-like flavin-dependent oxidoreductase (luciferase family)